jgi:multicomponent Na+:H+ antiporter subunit D
MLTGGTSFASAVTVMKLGAGSPVGMLAAGLFLAGLLIKGGLVPFHGWLPDAYSSAPAGVSVLLAGIVTKTTGIYTIIRLVTAITGFTPQLQHILLFFGALSMIAGAFAALGQKDFKRMLAYSSISQMGYIIMGLGASNPLAMMGAAFHLFNHSIFKTQLFINSAAVEEKTNTLDMDKLGGLAEKMPITGATSLIAFLSTAGVPPFAGFWSKLLIILGLWLAGFKVYALLGLLASVVTAAYFLSMQRRVFFGKTLPGFADIKEAGFALSFPAILLAAITIGAGIFFPYVLNNFIIPIKAILG